MPARGRQPIQDRYTAQIQAGSLSRQRAYQLRHKDAGLCIKCDHPAVSGPHCLTHAVYERERQRRSQDCERENECKTRRLERDFKPPNLDQLPAS